MTNYSTNNLIVIIIIVASIIPVVTFGIFTLEEQKISIENTKLELSREIVAEQKEKVTLYFNERLSDVSIFNKLPFVKNNLYKLFEPEVDPKIQNEFKELLNDVWETYGYESIKIIDTDFNSIMMVGHDMTHMETIFVNPDSSLKKHMSSGIFLSDVYTDQVQGAAELFVSVPIHHNQKLLGFLIYEIDLEKFLRDTLFEQELTQTGETVIAQKIGTGTYFINKLRFDDSPVLSYRIAPNTNLAIPTFESASGISGYGTSTDYRGEKVLAAWDYVPMTRWGLVAKIDYNEALEPLNQIIIETALVSFTLVAFSIFLGYFLSKKLTNPLQKLQEATIKVIKKNYDQTLTPSGSTEFQTIAKNFNSMIRSLKLSDELAAKHLEELSRIDIQKGEFAAMASHELKTPLVPIKGYLEMLMEKGLVGDFNPKQNELLEKIYDNTELLEKLILKILTAQRLGMGQMKWNTSEFDVEDLMNNVYSDNEYLMKDKNIKFTNLCTTNQIIVSDYTQILQIFSNLIRNSVDFVTDNPEIEISAENKSDEILFYVKDNGIGMDKEHLEHLFKKFYQIDTSVRRKHGGTGLGLSICKGLVEGLGGKIWVESKLNHGSTFYFTISKDQTKLK